MRIVLDTNRYSDFARGDAAAVRTISMADEVYLPFAVLGELRAGFIRGTRNRANETGLTSFLSKPDVFALFPDDATTHHYAAISQQMRRQGTPIPINDMWIAALALRHAFALYARDKHFDHLPQLMRI
jgi:tRNA(fMet)-specific endonuclease VapC